MRCTLKINGQALSLRIFEVDDTAEARGRVCNIELALLHFYGSHRSEIVEKDNSGKLVFQFNREEHVSQASSYQTYLGAKKVLAGFGVWWREWHSRPVKEGFMEEVEGAWL